MEVGISARRDSSRCSQDAFRKGVVAVSFEKVAVRLSERDEKGPLDAEKLELGGSRNFLPTKQLTQSEPQAEENADALENLHGTP